jgi:hypothetical protein
MAELSAYELLRQENIKRNEDFLRKMGLDKKKVRNSSHDGDADGKALQKKAVKKRKVEDIPVLQPTRRSRRMQEEGETKLVLRGIDEGQVKVKKEKPATVQLDVLVDEEDTERVHVTADSLRDYIASVNPTALHEVVSDAQILHCAFRINTMSTKALATRIKAIARAAGSKSYEKLLVFYYGLAASNLSHLASSCRMCLNNIGVVVEN